MELADCSRRRCLRVLLTSIMVGPGLGARLAGGETALGRAEYVADVGLLYGALNLHLDGVLTESADRAAGRYAVTMAGEGNGIASKIESRGLLRAGRWVPLESHSLFNVRERESRSDIAYDWTQRTIAYRFRGETFLRGRLRIADDLIAVPDGMNVDDAASAALNYADGSWAAEADGTLLTHIARRQKPDDEGPDDSRGTYRAEVVPLRLMLGSDPASGKPTALFDLSRFSSWARRDEPARITFGHDRRPESLALDMILGTTVRVEMRYPEPRRSQDARS